MPKSIIIPDDLYNDILQEAGRLQSKGDKLIPLSTMIQILYDGYRENKKGDKK